VNQQNDQIQMLEQRIDTASAERQSMHRDHEGLQTQLQEALANHSEAIAKIEQNAIDASELLTQLHYTASSLKDKDDVIDRLTDQLEDVRQQHHALNTQQQLGQDSLQQSVDALRAQLEHKDREMARSIQDARESAELEMQRRVEEQRVEHEAALALLRRQHTELSERTKEEKAALVREHTTLLASLNAQNASHSDKINALTARLHKKRDLVASLTTRLQQVDQLDSPLASVCLFALRHLLT